jgi:hypothetical protein
VLTKYKNNYKAGISWIEERLLVNRERASGTYGDLSFFVAKVLVETPIHILQTGLFVTIMYLLFSFRVPDSYRVVKGIGWRS